MRNRIFGLISILFFDLAACRATPCADVSVTPTTKVHLATLPEGAAVLGTPDAFVRAMSPFDRAARLKSKEDVSEGKFLDFVKKQGLAWNKAETAAVGAALEKIAAKARAFKLSLPGKILLVKTTGLEEGGASYTRGTSIVLPKAVAEKRDEELEPVLAHELFHVMSRHDAALREALYKIIGFEPAGEIEPPAEIKPRMITNPDSARPNWRMEVVADGAMVFVTPVLYASQSRYDPKKGREFFNYLTFKLLVIEKRENQWVASSEGGRPRLLEPQDIPMFEQKTGRNTQYVIDPDEMLADNFVLLLDGKTVVPTPQIIDEMRKVLPAKDPK